MLTRLIDFPPAEAGATVVATPSVNNPHVCIESQTKYMNEEDETVFILRNRTSEEVDAVKAN